jgi:hypothetical protein
MTSSTFSGGSTQTWTVPNGINALLLNDEDLSEQRRSQLICERKAYRFIFERFGLAPVDNAIQALDQLVDSKLVESGVVLDNNDNQ